MLKDTSSPLVVRRNEYFSAVSLISLHGDNNEDFEKQDIVTNIYFEAVFTSIKGNFFNHLMVDFVNKLYLSDQKYQTNINAIYEKYKGKLLFTMNNFVSFGTYCQSMF